jgi:hypothetical protein
MNFIKYFTLKIREKNSDTTLLIRTLLITTLLITSINLTLHICLLFTVISKIMYK